MDAFMIDEIKDGVDRGQFNIGYLCSGYQCEKGLANKLAMRYINASGKADDFTFADVDRESNRFANMLSNLGVTKGDRVFTFLPKAPEQFFAFLGTLKREAVCGTLFANFGDEALLDRLGDAGPKVVVTKKSLAKKVLRIADQLPMLEHILVVDSDENEGLVKSYHGLAQVTGADYETPITAAETPSVLHYTSGSTGKPKGVQHCHATVLNQAFTGKNVLGLKPDDIFWCTADQGWVTGTSYGIIAPWVLGITQIQFAGQFDKDEWFRLLNDQKVTCWYTAPTALRMLMKADPTAEVLLNSQDLSRIFSVGEPLNPEVMFWGEKVFEQSIYDTWFQTETGAIMITNSPGLTVKPGSMGKPITGIEPAILDDKGNPCAVGEQGNLCVKTPWPSMFRTYLNNDSAYQSKFKGDYYYTGDTAYVDQEGYFWFCGRSDDVINTSGHLVSPFEVESALLEIDEVAESGVVGLPDEMLFEKIVAFVALNDGAVGDRKLTTKLKLHVSKRASSVAAPHEIVFVDSVPKNKSGKIMRRVLRARYLGEDEGDTSTLEA